MTASASNLPAAPAEKGRGAPSPWVLPEDGIVDPIAVQIAAAGERRVALTHAERLLAAAKILAAGHHLTEMAGRLHVSSDAARAAEARSRQLQPLVGPRAACGSLALVVPEGGLEPLGGARPPDGRGGQARASTPRLPELAPVGGCSARERRVTG